VYLARRGRPVAAVIDVGMMAWSLDMIGTLISDWNYTPTSSADCRNKAGGLTVRNYFRAYG